MRRIYIVGGTMGVGKTTTCRILQQRLDSSVFLDGDWCWDMHPFQVTQETKKMVLENIIFLLNNFIHCSAYKNIIFCWVMHQQDIIDDILSWLDTSQCQVHTISLVCSEEALQKRLQRDVDMEIRTADVIPRSLERVRLYETLDTVRIDVSDIPPEYVAELIIKL